VTPKSFLAFLETYKTTYKTKHKTLLDMANRMTSGLEKLEEATVSVDLLSLELIVKEKELTVANLKADKVKTYCTVSCFIVSNFVKFKIGYIFYYN